MSELDWSSAVGLFIINFGALDYLVLDFLESRLSPERFAEIKDRHLQDRIKMVRAQFEESDQAPGKRERFQRFFQDLDPVRELRNRIAHSHILVRLDLEKKQPVMTLSLPKDLDAIYSPGTRHLTLEEMKGALAALNRLIEEFQALTGYATVVPGDIQGGSP